MNTPQSPFTALQELQEEQREGYTQETPRTAFVEAGPYPVRAMPHLARDLERELAEKDAKLAEQAAQIAHMGINAKEVFARAVREAVEKEQQQGIGFLSSDKRGDWPDDFSHENGNYCVPCCECGKNFMGHKRRAACKICVGIKDGIKQADEITSLMRDKADAIAIAQAAERETSREQDMRSKDREEIARLTAELEQANERVEAKQEAYERCAGLFEEERLKNIKANAELERLRWRSVEVKPTREDADANGYVSVMGSGNAVQQWFWNASFHGGFKFWRPCCPPPAPTAEEVERERFEVAKASIPEFGSLWPLGVPMENDASLDELRARIDRLGFKAWQAARAAKEGEK